MPVQSEKLYKDKHYFLKTRLVSVCFLHLVILCVLGTCRMPCTPYSWVKPRSDHFQHQKIKCASVFKNWWISSNKWCAGIFKAPEPFRMSRSAKCNIRRTGLGTINMATAYFNSLDNPSLDVEFTYLPLELPEKIFTKKKISIFQGESL